MIYIKINIIHYVMNNIEQNNYIIFLQLVRIIINIQIKLYIFLINLNVKLYIKTFELNNIYCLRSLKKIK